MDNDRTMAAIIGIVVAIGVIYAIGWMNSNTMMEKSLIKSGHAYYAPDADGSPKFTLYPVAPHS